MDGVALDGKPEWCKCEAKGLDGGRRGFSGLKRKRCQRAQRGGNSQYSVPSVCIALDVVEDHTTMTTGRRAGRKEESDKERVRKSGACLASRRSSSNALVPCTRCGCVSWLLRLMCGWVWHRLQMSAFFPCGWEEPSPLGKQPLLMLTLLPGTVPNHPRTREVMETPGPSVSEEKVETVFLLSLCPCEIGFFVLFPSRDGDGGGGEKAVPLVL